MLDVAWNVPGVVEFVAERAGVRPDFGNCRTAGVFRDGVLIAGVVFHNWSPEFEVIEVSAASDDPKWASRTVLRKLFGYVFSVAQLCVARTAETNVRTRRLWKAFGAEEHVIPRLRGRMASEAVLTLTDDAWAASRFMRQTNEQTARTEPA